MRKFGLFGLAISLALVFFVVGDTQATSTLQIDGTPYTVLQFNLMDYSDGANGEAGSFVVIMTQSPPNGVVHIQYSNTAFSFSGNYWVSHQEPTIDGNVKVTFALFVPQSGGSWSRD